MGHAFEAPSGLIVVAGGILGPTNGSVWPYALAISADGRTVQRQAIQAHMFWGSAVGVSANCKALLVATEGDARASRVEARALAAEGLGDPAALRSFRATSDSDATGMAGLAPIGVGFPTRDAFLGEAERNPFTASGMPSSGIGRRLRGRHREVARRSCGDAGAEPFHRGSGPLDRCRGRCRLRDFNFHLSTDLH